MTTIERPEKRALLGRCDHVYHGECERCRAALDQVLARWDALTPELPAEHPGREVVVLAEIRQHRTRSNPQPLEILDDDERHGDSLLGAVGAWACVAISALLMLAIAIRQLWLVIFG